MSEKTARRRTLHAFGNTIQTKITKFVDKRRR